MKGLSKDNSERIEFVVAALFSSAIDVSELRQWAENVLVENEQYPLWLVDLMAFDGSPQQVFEIIGFEPVTSLIDKERNALLGITVARSRVVDSSSFSQRKAIQALRAHPEVLQRFKSEFPFVADSINEAVEPPTFEGGWEAADCNLSGELERELPNGHVLNGVPVETIARRTGCDEVLFKLEDGTGRYAVVHLTWKKEVDPSWPWTLVLDDWNAFVEIMSEDPGF